MSHHRLMRILVSPLITEKATRAAEKNRQIVFKVLPDANKIEVKQAVEKLFSVKVSSVQICNVKGKPRRFGQIMGKRKSWKKAYVGLKEGYDINFANTAAE